MIDELGIGGFVLKQDDDFLKLGTDAMLLSDFARISKAGTRVCDLGCGNGAISILIAARHAQAHIDAIEIMPGAARLAHENVELNGLSSRMRVLCGDIKDVRKHYATESFDCVVANPPYLASGGGLKTDNMNLRHARMEIDGTIADFCCAARYLLKFGGSFCVVYRPERLSVLMAALLENGFTPKRMRLVQNSLSAPPSLVLMEARRGGRHGMKVLPTLLVRDADGSETEEIRNIYHRQTYV